MDNLTPEQQQAMERALYDAGYYVAKYGDDHRCRLYHVKDHRVWREPGQPQWWHTWPEALDYGYQRFVRDER